MRRKLNDTWKSIKPETKRPTSATKRDTSNVALGTSVAMVVVWVLHDAMGVNVPPEVAAAFGTIGGYVTGRFLRY